MVCHRDVLYCLMMVLTGMLDVVDRLQPRRVELECYLIVQPLTVVNAGVFSGVLVRTLPITIHVDPPYRVQCRS